MLKELGVGGLLLTAVWRGVRWATEVLDKVQGLVYIDPTLAEHEVYIHSLSEKSQLP